MTALPRDQARVAAAQAGFGLLVEQQHRTAGRDQFSGGDQTDQSGGDSVESGRKLATGWGRLEP